FPTLSLEQIHGAIAFYLGHQEEAAAYLRDLEKKWEELERAAKPAPRSSSGSRKPESACWRNRREKSGFRQQNPVWRSAETRPRPSVHTLHRSHQFPCQSQ